MMDQNTLLWSAIHLFIVLEVIFLIYLDVRKTNIMKAYMKSTETILEWRSKHEKEASALFLDVMKHLSLLQTELLKVIDRTEHKIEKVENKIIEVKGE